MLITSDGDTAGALSAGCIEEEVAMHARDVVASGEPKLIAFDTRRRFGCSGSIEIFIELLDEQVMERLRDTIGGRRACTLVTVFEDSERLGSQNSRTQNRVTTHSASGTAARIRAVGGGPGGSRPPPGSAAPG